MDTTFELRPYEGAGPIEFGMTRSQVEARIGPPTSVTTTRGGDVEEYRAGLKLYFSKSEEHLREIVLMKPSSALYRGVDLIQTEDPTTYLAGDDPEPFEYAGTVLFLKVGIAVTGFAEENDPDSAVGMFERGRWDDLREHLRPWLRGALR